MALSLPKPMASTTVKRTVGRNRQSLVLMGLVSLILFAGIGSRLAYLQLVRGNRHHQLAEDNRIRLLPTPPGRGNVFDREGRLLASSRLSHSVFLWPIDREPEEWPETLALLGEILDVPADKLQTQLEKHGYTSPSRVRVVRNIGPAEITALAEYGEELKGVEVDVEAARYYPEGEVAAHLLGYTGEINDKEFETRKDEGYRLSDVIGKMGVELAFEAELRGEWGGRQVEVDGSGQVVGTLGRKDSQAGQDIHLTIDLDIQKAAEAALGNANGAVVVMDPKNGEILAMASRPVFDPNIFSGRIPEEAWQKLQEAYHPFVNRAIQAFPPASTFKIVTTTAAIESGGFPPDTVLQTYPYRVIGGIQFGEWNHAGFGPLGFVGAMAWSSDTFFYQVAERIGGPTLIDWTRRYGFGRKTGIELSDEEAVGIVPDDAWKRERVGTGWAVGDAVNMSIGQGYLTSTPIQVAMMFAVPANGGYLVRPHVLKSNQEAKRWRKSLNISPETIEILQKGLRRVVTGGTGPALNVSSIPASAGKSGTSEVAPGKENHTWFGGYAPLNNPEIVVVVFGEHSGGGGGSFAAPKVRQVIEAYFRKKRRIITARDDLGDRG